jgi:hypothetical protein
LSRTFSGGRDVPSQRDPSLGATFVSPSEEIPGEEPGGKLGSPVGLVRWVRKGERERSRRRRLYLVTSHRRRPQFEGIGKGGVEYDLTGHDLNVR